MNEVWKLNVDVEEKLDDDEVAAIPDILELVAATTMEKMYIEQGSSREGLTLLDWGFLVGVRHSYVQTALAEVIAGISPISIAKEAAYEHIAELIIFIAEIDKHEQNEPAGTQDDSQ